MDLKAQNRIFRLFARDPHAAMELAVEQYTGLVWKTAGQYLENPEDIKECVNDTFMEFYLHRERFDPQKGSLAAFLTSIARNRAISLYRKNKARQARELGEVTDDRDEAGGLELKLDLDRAMETLKPEDREIIRMKYYVGMTIEEIAESLHLPYETVKKRHQRSLGKLRLALIAALILVLAMLLAACAYIMIRFFNIIPGYGFTEEPDIPAYVLDGETVVENEYGKYVIKHGVLVNGDFMADGKAFFPSKDKSTWHLEMGVSTLDYGSETVICLGAVDYGEDRDWAAFNMSAEGLAMPEEGESGCSMTLHFTGAGVDFPLTFRLAGTQEAGIYDCWTGDHGGLLIIPGFDEGHLVLEAYPMVNDGRADVDWENPPYLKDADGRRLDPVWTDYRGNYIRMDFGEAPPGEYQACIPALRLREPYEGGWDIGINLETCQWDGKEYEIPGGTVSLAYCKPVELQAGEYVGSETGIMEEVREGYSYWEIGLRYRLEEPEEAGYGPPWVDLMQDCDILMEMDGMEVTRISIGEEDGLYRQMICIPDGLCDLTTYRLTPLNEVTTLWKCNAVIPFTAEEE